MIHYAVLGSGSSGNSYIFSHNGEAILIDAGFSYKELSRRIAQTHIDIQSVQALFLTHLHPDHSRGAGVFSRKTHTRVFVHQDILDSRYEAFTKLGIDETLMSSFSETSSIQIGSFTISPFLTSHDSPHSVGFIIEVGKRKMMVLTDTGCILEHMKELAKASDILFIEANYDEQLLLTGPYPFVLKKRIRGSRGHLSNSDAMAFLSDLPLREGQMVYFCHLSKINNHPDKVAHLCNGGFCYTVCHNGCTYTGCIDIGVKT